MSSKDSDRSKAEREQAARERGGSIPHYTKEVGRELASKRRRGRSTPSKKAED